MFIWRLWGNVFAVGNSGDFLTYLIIQVIWITFLVLLTVAIIIPVLVFMSLRAGYGVLTDRAAAQSAAVTDNDAVLLSKPLACPHCGNTSSLDITPCIRCGQ